MAAEFEDALYCILVQSLSQQAAGIWVEIMRKETLTNRLHCLAPMSAILDQVILRARHPRLTTGFH
jgi:hypothetical protein